MPQVKFISYSGEYPNLCSGKLVVQIDGKEISFSPYTTVIADLISSEEVGQYHKFRASGGSVSFDKEWRESVLKGEWEIDEIYKGEYPKEIQDALPEIIKVFNENVPEGCCGGCV